MIYDIDGHEQSDTSFGNKASIIETRTTNRIQPIHFGVNYHEKPLEFTLVFGSDQPISRREFESISLWLTGSQQYQWLSIHQPDLDHIQYRCLITELTPISVGWVPYAFEATVTCDCPYAYGLPFKVKYNLDGTKGALFRNHSSVYTYFKPVLRFAAQSDSLTIVNHSDGDREFSLSSIPIGATIEVDNSNGIIRSSGGENLYSGFNLNFLRLVRGNNDLQITGTGTLTITGRFLHNVGG